MFHYSGNLHYMSQLPEDLFEERYAGSILEGSVIGFQIGHALRQDEEDWPVTDVENVCIRYSMCYLPSREAYLCRRMIKMSKKASRGPYL